MNLSDSFAFSSNTLQVERKYFQTSVDWKIVCPRKRVQRIGDAIISPVFQCSDTSWKFTLYPFREKEENSYYMDLHLNNVSLKNEGLERKFTAYFKINIIANDKTVIYEYVSKKCIFLSGVVSQRFSFSPYYPYGIYLDSVNCLTISLILCVEENVFPVAPLGEPTEFRKDEEKKPQCLGCASSSLAADFEKLYDNPHRSDVTLKLGEVEFRAHKAVLGARSRVFAAMFEHDMEENRLDAVDLVQMEAGTVQDMLRHIYCGKVRELSLEEALKLYVAADRYDLEELRAFCREKVVNDLCVDNVCDIAAVAYFHNDEKLISALKPFISENGKEVVKSEKWKEYFVKDPTLCAKMFEWSFSE